MNDSVIKTKDATEDAMINVFFSPYTSMETSNKEIRSFFFTKMSHLLHNGGAGNHTICLPLKGISTLLREVLTRTTQEKITDVLYEYKHAHTFIAIAA